MCEKYKNVLPDWLTAEAVNGGEELAQARELIEYMAVASCLSAWVRRPPPAARARRAACERRPAAIVYNYTILLLCDKLSRYASVCLWFAPLGSAAITVAVFML